jgi:hypothetical protein
MIRHLTVLNAAFTLSNVIGVSLSCVTIARIAKGQRSHLTANVDVTGTWERSRKVSPALIIGLRGLKTCVLITVKDVLHDITVTMPTTRTDPTTAATASTALGLARRYSQRKPQSPPVFFGLALKADIPVIQRIRHFRYNLSKALGRHIPKFHDNPLKCQEC